MTGLTLLFVVSTTLAMIYSIYAIGGAISSLFYNVKKAEEPEDNVIFSITTVGSEHIRSALYDVIDHQLEKFPNHPLYVTVDEDSDLVDDLVDDERFETIVVPNSFTCKANAKGRAIQYFIENVVEEHPNYWYCFFDDDNKILSDDILYEIPYYDDLGYGAANPVLVPRPGRSEITFVMDHIRTLDDMTVFRAFTGLFKSPLMGFHGELLTAKGDVLLDIGFNRESIVEDYSFAMRLIENGVKTWQTHSRVSILSPHTIRDLFNQRRRWYIGIVKEQIRNPLPATFITGFRLVSWTLAPLAGISFLPVWLSFGNIHIPLYIELIIIIGTIVYSASYIYGSYSVGGIKSIAHIIISPIYAAILSFTSLYAILTKNTDFVVIEK